MKDHFNQRVLRLEQAALELLGCHHDHILITLTASQKGSSDMAEQTFPVGTTVDITAEVTQNGVSIADTLSYSATSGTIVLDASDPSTLTATLTGAEPGDVTVTATDEQGNTGTLTIEFEAAPEPVTITLTASAAPTAPAPVEATPTA